MNEENKNLEEDFEFDELDNKIILWSNNTILNGDTIYFPRCAICEFSENKIKSAACMLPLSDDKHISKGLGTRHRSAIGMSKESDSIVVVVSEETGKISIAKNGTLIMDVKEEALKQILIKNIVTKQFGEEHLKDKLKKKAEIKEENKDKNPSI